MGDNQENIGTELDFEPNIVETPDINQALMLFSRENSIPISEVDFDIEGVFTVAENLAEKSSIIYNMSIEKIIPLDILSSVDMHLHQNYVINIHSLHPNPMVKLEFSLSADKHFTKVLVKIKKESTFRYYDNLSDYIYDEINKKASRYKILLFVFEDGLKHRIEKFTDTLKDDLPLEQDVVFTYCENTGFKPAVDDKIVYYYKEKQKRMNEEEKVDLYNRGFISDVALGEILVEYTKAREGVAARNCKGEFLYVGEPKVEHIPDFKVASSVDKLDDEYSIKYIALKSGYVTMDGGVLDIRDELKMTELSFRKTGSIIVDESKEITLDISEKNPMVDAIGSNMTAKATTIIVHGSTGESSKVYAETATIEGLTHKSSQVYAKKININIHKGFAEGEDVTIANIEGGKVVAEQLNVNELTNAEIRAKKVFITNLGSNNNITASEFIQIKNIIGTDNFLNIEAAATPSELHNMENLDIKFRDFKKVFFEKRTQYEKMAHYVKENKKSALKIRAMLDEDRKNGRTPHQAFLRKYEHFLKLVEKFKAMKEEIDDMDTQMKNLEHEIGVIQDRILSAKVINQGTWLNYQVINYRLTLHSEPIRYVPPEGEKIKFIGIQKTGDNKYEVGPIQSDSKVETPNLRK